MTQKIVYPFGWLAGHESPAPEVIKALAIEMLGHRSNLMESALRYADDQERGEMTRLAETLERYAVIVDVIYFQMEPERWTPKTMSGLLDLAEKHKITLPDWMKGENDSGEEIPRNTNFIPKKSQTDFLSD